MENKESNALMNNLNALKNFTAVKVWTIWFQIIISFWLGYILTMLFVKSSFMFLNWEVVLTVYIGTIVIGWILSLALTQIINALKHFMDMD